MKKLFPFILSGISFLAAVSASAQDSSRMSKETAISSIKKGNEKGEKIQGAGKVDWQRRKPLKDSLVIRNNNQNQSANKVKWKIVSN